VIEYVIFFHGLLLHVTSVVVTVLCNQKLLLRTSVMTSHITGYTA